MIIDTVSWVSITEPLSCLSVTLVYCGQTVGWVKVPLGTEVGLGPRDIVSDEDGKGHSSQAATHFSAHVCCGQTVAHLIMCPACQRTQNCQNTDEQGWQSGSTVLLSHSLLMLRFAWIKLVWTKWAARLLVRWCRQRTLLRSAQWSWSLYHCIPSFHVVHFTCILLTGVAATFCPCPLHASKLIVQLINLHKIMSNRVISAIN